MIFPPASTLSANVLLLHPEYRRFALEVDRRIRYWVENNDTAAYYLGLSVRPLPRSGVVVLRAKFKVKIAPKFFSGAVAVSDLVYGNSEVAQMCVNSIIVRARRKLVKRGLGWVL